MFICCKWVASNNPNMLGVLLCLGSHLTRSRCSEAFAVTTDHRSISSGMAAKIINSRQLRQHSNDKRKRWLFASHLSRPYHNRRITIYSTRLKLFISKRIYLRWPMCAGRGHYLSESLVGLAVALADDHPETIPTIDYFGKTMWMLWN